MKIIGTDNFDTETVNDILIAENVSEFNATKITRLLNKDESRNPGAPYYFKAVPDDYKLYKFEP